MNNEWRTSVLGEGAIYAPREPGRVKGRKYYIVMLLEVRNMVKKVIVKIISAKDKLKEKEIESEEDKLLIPMCAWACELNTPPNGVKETEDNQPWRG